MTSDTFEVMAKAAIALLCEKQFDETYSADDIQLVWFAHVLGSKKGILIDNGDNRRIYEVTYNMLKDELYIDCYEKHSKMTVKGVSDIPDIGVTP